MPQKQVDQHNPYSSGLVIVGMAGVVFGLLLLSSFEPRAHEIVSPWQILGVALICIGALSFIALLVAGMLIWQPTATHTAPATTLVEQSPSSQEIVVRKAGRPGWYDDPFGRGERFFDGFNWTDRTLALHGSPSS